MSECVLVKSIRGADVLISDGYTYHLNKKVNETHYWRCAKKSKANCGVTLTTKWCHDKHTDLKLNHDHDHPPDPEALIRRKLTSSLKDKAGNSMDSPAQIIQRCIQDVPPSCAPHLPNKVAMTMTIQRTRNKNMPALPKTVHDVEIPEEFVKFMIGHYTYKNESVLVFTTKENVQLLQKAQYWLMDGTFQCSPKPYIQIYTVHARVGSEDGVNKILPLVYGLLSHKTQNCYKIFLEILRCQALSCFDIRLSPKFIILDFEIAAINAVKLVFPDCAQKLCFFHLTQTIWRHIQSAGLAKRYGTDPGFAHKMRHLAALAFLEPHEIPSAFQMLKENIFPEEAKEIVEWFEKYYINGSFQRRTLKNPQFPPEMWCIYDRYVSSVPVTQNALESWHNRWNTLLNRKKWNLFKTIAEFQKEQKNTECTIERITSSEPMAKRKRGSSNTQRIMQHYSKKNEMDINDFLSGLAYICYIKH